MAPAPVPFAVTYFPWLSRSNSRIAREANSFVLRTVEACEAACSTGGHFLLEHPENLGITRAGLRPGSIWDWPETRELQLNTQAFTWAVFQCEFGAPTSKPTRFLSSVPFAALSPCQGWPSIAMAPTKARCHVLARMVDMPAACRVAREMAGPLAHQLHIHPDCVHT